MAGSVTSRRDNGRWFSLAAAPVAHLVLLLGLAILLGGGGVAYGMRNLVIQLAALVLLALHAGLVARFWRESSLVLRLLVGATLALPLLLLIPLPPGLWQALPGRDAVLASHAVAGLGDNQWFPASLDRARTLVAFTGLIAPATIVMIGAMLPAQDRLVLGWAIASAAFVVLLIGVVQLQGANTAGLFYPVNAQADVLYGTFANRNSTGLLLVLGLCLAIAVARTDKPKLLVTATVIGVLLMIGVFLTKSRSSMVLLAAPVALLALRSLVYLWARRSRAPSGEPPSHRSFSRSSAGAFAALLCVLAVGAVGWSAMGSGRVADSISRFQDGQADRPEMWEDGIYAAGQYWPVGSGTGTFDEVFQVHESLEHVSPRRAGRAHSDWIELAMEAGLVGLVLGAGWLLWATVQGWRHLIRASAWSGAWIGVGAGAGVGAVALQSILDYPLRNQTLLCLVAFLVVFLIVPEEKSRKRPVSGEGAP
jgi:O-antigen ligase